MRLRLPLLRPLTGLRNPESIWDSMDLSGRDDVLEAEPLALLLLLFRLLLFLPGLLLLLLLFLPGLLLLLLLLLVLLLLLLLLPMLLFLPRLLLLFLPLLLLFLLQLLLNDVSATAVWANQGCELGISWASRLSPWLHLQILQSVCVRLVCSMACLQYEPLMSVFRSTFRSGWLLAHRLVGTEEYGEPGVSVP